MTSIRVTPGRALIRSTQGCEPAITVPSTGDELARASSTACWNAADASSIFPISSTTTHQPASTARRIAGTPTRSSASTSTPYLPTRGAPRRSTWASVARRPSSVASANPTRAPATRTSSVTNPPAGRPSRSSTRRRHVVFPAPGRPVSSQALPIVVRYAGRRW